MRLATMNALSRYSGFAFFLLRVIVGLLFACHGGQKILGFPPSGQPPHPLDTLGLVGGWIELAGGFAIALGLFTRIAAFLASGEMAVGYFMAHFSAEKFFPIQNKGELAVVYCFVFLFIFFHGAGPFSLDALLFRPKTATPAA